ncbi:MAG: MFS transporter [Gammaproteobacteria bacterium]|nr:MFS transporter [Gammaproteobacteria bacterium]
MKVPVRIAAAWGLGTFATTTMLNGVSVVLLYFLVTFVKVEPVIAGAMLFGSKLLDVFTDPPMGILSDRTRSRWGRRRPYLLGASLFCGLSFALLFSVPESAGNSGVYLYVSLALVLYALSYTVFQVPYMAMPAEMTSDYHERTRVMSWRVVFMTLGNMVGSAGAPGLVKLLGEDRAAYADMGLIIGALIFAAMLICAVGTRGAKFTTADEITVPFAEQIGWLWRNKPLLVLMGIKIAIYTGISSFVAVMLFFIYSVLKKGPEVLVVYSLVQTASTIAFTPACAWLSRQIGKKPAYVLCLLGFAAGLMTWLLATPDESMWVLAIRALFIGAFAAGSFLYGNSMLIDTFAYDYKISGMRREGVLSAAFSFVEKASLALGPLLIGALLSGMGFDKDLDPTEDQTPSAVRAMYIGFIWIPAGCQLVAAMLLRFYRLKKSDLEGRSVNMPSVGGG